MKKDNRPGCKFVFIFLIIFLIAFFIITTRERNSTSTTTVEESSINKGDYVMKTEMIDIEVAAEGEPALTRNFYFIFDGSGSMANECSGRSKMDGAKATIQNFIKNMPEDINLGLIIFDHNNMSNNQKEIIPLGPVDKINFETKILESKAGGGTPLATCIEIATDKLIEQYKRQLGYGDYRIITITDGIADNLKNASAYTYKFGIPMYTIGLCMDFEHPLKKYSLAYFDAQSFKDLGNALEEAVAETTSFDPQEFN